MVKVKAIGDVNCLFRCFSHFLYNNQNLHRKVRLNIIDNIVEKWNNYKIFIIGNDYYTGILDYNDYKEFMSEIGIYGSEIEIQSFSEMYNVDVTVYFDNSNIIHNFGQSLNRNSKLKLLFSGNLDGGHYDILGCQNINIRYNEVKRKNANYCKRTTKNKII